MREVWLHADTATLVTETLRGAAPVLALGAVLAIAATVVAETVRHRVAREASVDRAHASAWLQERYPRGGH